MTKNYYEESLENINKLINEKKYQKAYDIISE